MCVFKSVLIMADRIQSTNKFDMCYKPKGILMVSMGVYIRDHTKILNRIHVLFLGTNFLPCPR